MNEAVSEFEKLFMQYDYSFKVADVVKGTIIKKENDYYLVDIGSKTEAIFDKLKEKIFTNC